jgi:hypothetical protein
MTLRRDQHMPDQPEDVRYLRGLAARLRSLAVTEATIADQLRRIADETDDRADAMAARLRTRGRAD